MQQRFCSLVLAVSSILAMKMSSSKSHNIVVFCCNWVIMVTQLSNSPKVAQPSNNCQLSDAYAVQQKAFKGLITNTSLLSLSLSAKEF